VGNEEKFSARFAKVIDLDQKGEKILSSIRFRDQDQSTKGGAILAFAGLLIASSLVQFTAPPESILALQANSVFAKASYLGLALLFLSSFFSLWSLVASRSYSQDVQLALLQFDRLVSKRAWLIRLAFFFCFLGTVCFLITLYGSILSKI